MEWMEDMTMPANEQMLSSLLEYIAEYDKSIQKVFRTSRNMFSRLREKIDLIENDWYRNLLDMKKRDIAEMETAMKEIEDKMKRTQSKPLEETNKHSSLLTISLPQLVVLTQSEYELPDKKDLIGSLKSESRECA